ncbi:reverse transcriptase domain-containing protein [Tanacetum coccineum]
MTSIFHEHIEDNMEVFMDDFSVFGSSFDHCLKNLEKMLKRCEETNLVLKWEKCHFMVKEGIVLGHKVSGSGIEVDKAKIEAISKLPYPTNMKAIRSFLGHAGFYRRFIRVFLQIARLMTQLLVKDAPFNLSEECAENLAADHLSRLEHPDLEKLTRADIKDLFPEERLMTISNKDNEPWTSRHRHYRKESLRGRVLLATGEIGEDGVVYGASEHSDNGMIALLATDGVPGLQVIFDEKKLGSSYKVSLDDSQRTI